jgi:Zn-finger protein
MKREKENVMRSNWENAKEYKFFNHSKCEFFPCHETEDQENFNCLFCYCPLYAMGRDCGGNFSYTETGVKDCSSCMVPHKRNNYDYMIEKMGQFHSILAEKELEKRKNEE